MTAKLAHHPAIVNLVGDFGRATGDHHAGYYYNLTGHAPDQTFRTQGNNRPFNLLENGRALVELF